MDDRNDEVERIIRYDEVERARPTLESAELWARRLEGSGIAPYEHTVEAFRCKDYGAIEGWIREWDAFMGSLDG